MSAERKRRGPTTLEEAIANAPKGAAGMLLDGRWLVNGKRVSGKEVDKYGTIHAMRQALEKQEEDLETIKTEMQEADKPFPVLINMPGVDQDAPSDTPASTRRAGRERAEVDVTVRFGSDE